MENTSLSNEGTSSQTENDIKAIHKTKKELMELIKKTLYKVKYNTILNIILVKADICNLLYYLPDCKPAS